MQADAARLEPRWRGRGQIENGVHDVHDVRDALMGEEACQVRSDRAPANRAACRTTALNLLRQAGITHVAAALMSRLRGGVMRWILARRSPCWGFT